MEKKLDLGTYRMNATEIANGFLLEEDYGTYYHPTFDNLFYKFVTENLVDKLYNPSINVFEKKSWKDVRQKIFEALINEGEGFCPNTIDYEVEIKIKATVHEFD